MNFNFWNGLFKGLESHIPDEVSTHIGKGGRLIKSMTIKKYERDRWLVRFAFRNKGRYLICQHLVSNENGINFSTGWLFATSDVDDARERFYRG